MTSATDGLRLHHTVTERLAEPLRDWLPHQRWYASKGRAVAGARVVASTTVLDVADSSDGEVGCEHLVVEVTFADGGDTERYQVPVGLRREPPVRLDHVRIGELDVDGEQWTAYDALWDPELADTLLGLIAADSTRGTVRFAREPDAVLVTDLLSRVMDVEQSNTSLVYGEDYVLKLYRRTVVGVNPDLELHRALRRVGSVHVAEALGGIDGTLDDGPVTYGMLQRYATNSADGWAMATTSVRDLLAEADLRADEVGGDFAGESYRLGEAVAAVHGDLAAALGVTTVDPDGVAELARGMHVRLDAALRAVPLLADHEGALRRAYADLAESGLSLVVQRVHGDLHLGQVLRTTDGWLLIDFEGEPVRPLAERRAPDVVARDVAGMLRSFDYASHHLLLDGIAESQQEYRATEWALRNRSAFCDGYTAVAGSDPREPAVVLRAYELDKAVYETVYEMRHRPSWQAIPLQSVERLVGGHGIGSPTFSTDPWD